MTEETSKIVNAKQFLALIKAADQAKTKVASINGEIGERIKTAVEDGHLHAGAFKLILKLSRQDEDKRDEFLRQSDIYREMAIKGGLFGEEHTGDLDDLARKAAAEQAEDEESSRVAENVHRLETGIKTLSDEDKAFDDDTSGKPSRKGRKGVGEASGSYQLKH